MLSNRPGKAHSGHTVVGQMEVGSWPRGSWEGQRPVGPAGTEEDCHRDVEDFCIRERWVGRKAVGLSLGPWEPPGPGHHGASLTAMP